MYNNILSEKIQIKKSLRYKILFVVLPLFLISFGFFGVTAYFTSNNGITNVTKEFIGYQLKEIVEFSQEQSMLLDSNSTMFNNIVIQYAISEDSSESTNKIFIIIPYEKENISTNILNMSSSTNLSQNDISNLYDILNKQRLISIDDPSKYNSWVQFETENQIKLVGIFIPNTAVQAWFLLFISEEMFYQPVKTIINYLVIIVIVSLIVSSILILLFVNFITRPLTSCVETIKDITDNMDFSKRIRIIYPDEIGVLGQYFNDMVQELEKSYNQIKNYAYQTVIAKQKEERIRYIFQKYVPSEVIDFVLNKSTTSMLIGNKQKVTILFSDIRDFTTISEMLAPEELVLSLNVYFTSMVEQVIKNNGIIDKFIGDSIMAIFGAPVAVSTAPNDAVFTAIQMIKILKIFNKKQIEQKKITFDIGIGINTGEAIVGNIGSDQKLEYTVIGDPVNLGARLEGLTKSYKVPILISEFTKNELVDTDQYIFLNVDKVRVKGKAFPVVIYTPALKVDVSQSELMFFDHYHKAQDYYYQGHFQQAYDKFVLLQNSIYKSLIQLYIKRCRYLVDNPPTHWDGIETWTSK